MTSLKIRQAIVVATQEAAVGGTAQSAASVRVGGISLLKRTLMVLSRQGVERFAVVTHDLALRDALREDPAIAALRVSWVASDGKADAEGHAIIDAGARLLPGRFLVASADRIFDPKIAHELLRREGTGTCAAVAKSEALEPLVLPTGPIGFTGLFTADAAFLRELMNRDAQRRSLGHRRVLSVMAARGALEQLDVGTAYCQPVRDAATRATANRMLLDALRKPVDGLVARHINRNFSLFVTRFLKDTPIRPNHITVVSLLVAVLGGIVSASATAQTAWMLAIGAALWQLASMLDGVDGELARLKFSGSKLGEWLDTLSDDLGRLALFSGAAIGVGNVTGNPLWTYMLLSCVAMQVGLSVPLYRKLLQAGSGSHYALTWDAKGEKSRWDRFKAQVGFLSRRDAYILIWLAFAIIGWSEIAIVGTTLVTFLVVLNEIVAPRQVRSGPVTSTVPEVTAANVRPVTAGRRPVTITARARPVTPRTATARRLAV